MASFRLSLSVDCPSSPACSGGRNGHCSRKPIAVFGLGKSEHVSCDSECPKRRMVTLHERRDGFAADDQAARPIYPLAFVPGSIRVELNPGVDASMVAARSSA